MHKATICAALCALGTPACIANARAIDVVVSIKPDSCSRRRRDGRCREIPWLMLTGAASPHTYQMRPSEAEALSRADLVVWVGENMETFLDRPIANLGAGAEILTLHEAPGMKLLPSREGGIWSDEDSEHQDMEHEEHHDEHSGHGDEEHGEHGEHEEHDHEHSEHKEEEDEEHHDEHAGHGDEEHGEHGEHEEHGHEHSEHEGEEHGEHDDEHAGHEDEAHEEHGDGHAHDHGEFDLHIWLDPGNARRIVDVVADALARIDPLRAETYRANAEAMRMRIDELETSLGTRLAPVRERAFIVFHDGYGYFEDAFDLNSKGAVAVDPARPPSAKRLAELRGALAEHDVRCVFTEPQFEPDLVRTVIEGSTVRTAPLDPLGADVEPGPDAWFEIMRDLGDSIADCLGDA